MSQSTVRCEGKLAWLVRRYHAGIECVKFNSSGADEVVVGDGRSGRG